MHNAQQSPKYPEHNRRRANGELLEIAGVRRGTVYMGVSKVLQAAAAMGNAIVETSPTEVPERAVSDQTLTSTELSDLGQQQALAGMAAVGASVTHEAIGPSMLDEPQADPIESDIYWAKISADREEMADA